MKKVLLIIVALIIVLSVAAFAGCKTGKGPGGAGSTAAPDGSANSTEGQSAVPFVTPNPGTIPFDPFATADPTGTGAESSTDDPLGGSPYGATAAPTDSGGDSAITLPEDLFDDPTDDAHETPVSGEKTPANATPAQETPAQESPTNNVPTEKPTNAAGTAKPNETEQPTRDPGVIVLPEIPI